VVDDNTDAGDSLAVLLRLASHEVRVARDGTSALEAAASFCPEIVLLDIGLPGKSGFEVARELRGLPETQSALLVAVSGYGQEEDRRKAHKAGFDHYFTKPIDLPTLREVLGRPLRASR
jgi:two-component system CheB/CheR fusion protein